MTSDPMSRPILFSDPMVRAILAGRKTQTRRALKHQPIDILAMKGDHHGIQWIILEQKEPEPKGKVVRCRFGKAGDLLWVRETWCPIYPQDPNYNGGQPIEIDYRATPTERMSDHLGTRKWKPSIHMPRRHSRITLRITNVRVERLCEISPDDAAAEGWPGPDEQNSIASAYPIAWYSRLWEEINGRGSYDSNPWVWVVSFERIVETRAVA